MNVLELPADGELAGDERDVGEFLDVKMDLE